MTVSELNSGIAQPVLALPRAAKRIIALTVDASLCVLTVWLAYYLRLGKWVALSGDAFYEPLLAAAAAVALALPIFIVSGLYRAIFRYSGWPALMAVTRAIVIYGLLYAAIFTAYGVPGVPRTVGLIQPVLLLLAVGASRAFARYWLGEQYQGLLKRAALPKALIYGAGSAGRQLAAAMAHNQEMRVVGFLDDDDRLISMSILRHSEATSEERAAYLKRASASQGVAFDQAVVTIPANSRGLARHRTKLAAGMAGIQVQALINEPTAAAMSYSMRSSHEETLLVVDWGGGTLDVTVLKNVDGVFMEQSSKGIQQLGGLDFDTALSRLVLDTVSDSSTWSASDRAGLRLDIEKAKIELSTAEQVSIPLPGGGTPAGTIQFRDGVTNLGLPLPLNASGQAALVTAALPAGARSITAVYTPTGVNFNGSTSAALTQNVNLVTATGLTVDGPRGPVSGAIFSSVFSGSYPGCSQEATCAQTSASVQCLMTDKTPRQIGSDVCC